MACLLLCSADSPGESVGFATYYVLGDEADLIDAYQAIPNASVSGTYTASNLDSRLSIVSSADGNHVYLDEWENGYTFDPENPYNTADAKWDTPTGGTNDHPALARGEVLTLWETNRYVPGSQGVDGGDMIFISGAPVAVVRTVWPDDPPGSYIAGSWELYPVQGWQDAYTVPVGVDLSFPDPPAPFDYTFLFISTAYSNTRVVVTDPTLGVRLDQTCGGVTNIYVTNVTAGTTIVASDAASGAARKIQAGIMTSQNRVYDSRFFILTPEKYLGTKYVLHAPSQEYPVGEWTGETPITAPYVYAFYDDTTVTIYSNGGSTVTTLTNAGDVYRFEMPQMPRDTYQGFYGVVVEADKKIWVLVAGDDEGPHLDWGYQAMDEFYLKNNYYAPFAPANPGHITPLYDDTLIFVDWDNTGSNDLVAVLDRFENLELYDTADNDGTGAHIFGNKPFALAWGQDNTEHSPGEDPMPDFDYGFTVLPLYWYDPMLGIEKEVNPTNMPTSGGTSEVTLVVYAATQSVYNVDVGDALPPGWAYVTNSTTITFSDGSPTLTNNPSITNQDLFWDLDHDLGPTQTITVVFDMETVAGSYEYGWHVNQGESWGYSLNAPADSNNLVFNPEDFGFLYVPAPPTLTMDKSSPAALLDPGDTFTYTITITNVGATAQTGIRVRDYTPTGATYVAGSTWVITPNAPSNSVLDRFDNVSYGNQDGTADWLNDWQEEGDDGNVGAGDVLVTAALNTNVLRTKDNQNGAWRMADLSGATSAVFSFRWRRFLLDASDNYRAYVSSNGGGTWSELIQFTGTGGSDPAMNYTNFNITAWISTNTAIRFYSPDTTVGDAEGMDWDNVQITFWKPAGGTTNAGSPPNILVDGYTLPVGGTMTVTFDVTVNNPATVTNIVNTAYVRSDQQDQLEDTVTNYVITSMIGDWVWYDANTNGIQDAGEGGITGVTVNLYDGDTNFLQSTTTDADGYYVFTNLPPSNFVIRIEAPTNHFFSPADQGGSDTNDSDVKASGYSPVFALGRGTNETIWDAGMYVPPSTLGDWAWYDANTNGIQDAGESGATNVVIRLYDGSTNLVATTNTDSAGYYAFYGLVPGPYFLEVVPPPDYTLTQPDQGGSDTNDSDFAKDSQRTPVFDLPPGTNYLMWDAGFIPAMPGLKITKTSDWAGPDCWGAGDTITYTITVENTGIVGHAITTVTDPEPQGVTYVTNSTWVVAPTEGVTNTVRDEFNAVAYTNNDGTVDWAGDWVENDPYGAAGPVGDYVGVTGGRLFLHYAYVDDESAQRSADLTGSSSAAFGFEWETVGLDAGETISILVSTNSGGTFVTLDTLGGTASGSTNYDVSAYISADTTVRFVNQSQNWESGEYAYFDNVQIEFSSTDAGITTNAGGPPPTLAEGYTLKTGETMTITFEVTVDSPPDVTAITNTATVTSETQPPISASVTDCVVYADLAVTKTVSDPNPSETQSIEYQVIVTNNGPNDTTGVELTDVLPEGVQYHSHSNGVYNEITGIWSIGALAVGGTTTLYVNVTVDEGLGGATVTNWGCITHSDLYDPVETNNQDDAEFTPQYTFVLLSRFRAFAEDGAVVVEWETAAELGTIGFRVYREGTDGTWSTVHEGLLPSTLRPEGGTYRLVDRSAVIGGTHRYQLEEVEARGRSCLYGPFEVAVEGQGGGASRDVSAARKAGRGRSEPFARTGKTMGSDKAARVAERKDARDRWWDLRKRMKGNLAKVTVTEEGVYYVGAEALAEVLDMPLDTVKKMLQVRRMVLSNRGEDAAYVIAAGGEGLYFYGEKLDSIYTDRNVYWLGYGRGKPHETAEGHWPAAAPGGVFQDTIHVEENHLSVTAVVDDPEEDFWMWGYVFGGAPGSDTHAMDVVLPDAAATGSASVVVKLQGGSRSGVSPEHHVRVRVNGIEAGEATWTGTAACRFEAALDASLLVEGTNRVEVQALLGEGVPYSVVYVDCADIRYPRHYRARGGALKVRGDGNAVITVGGFGSGDISVVEVTQPHALGMMRGASVEADGTGGQWRVSFAAEAPEREYVAFEAPGLKTPESIVAAVRTKLAQSGNQGEYTIITTPELVEAAEVLADYRAGQGYKTEVVDLESIYDVFNYGIESPQAIRDFLYFAYYFWVQPPQYVVLAGEGTFDYKDHLGYADNLVPVKMMPTPYGLLESDSWYGDIAGDDGVPEIPVGRLPVMTSAELEAMAAKMEAYESGGGDWAKTLLMVADDPDDAGDFPGDSDDLGMLVPGGYVKDRIYLSERTLENARAALLGGLDSGALLVSYIGHGAMDRLAAEGLLTTADVSALDNGERLPVVLGMTCLAGRFGVPGFDCLAEELLLKPDGGAVAVWSPTGLSMNTLAKRLAEGFFLSRFTDGETVLGNISQSAFEDYGMGADPVYMLYIYNLLGDPALRVK